jgi:leucyl-tRNA synthetase
LRLYEMFMGPFDQAVLWNNDGIVGTYRFLERIWRLQEKVAPLDAVVKMDPKAETLLHQTIVKVSEDIEGMHFNTAISAMMILANELEKQDKIDAEWYKILIQLVAPFAPHIAEELWTIQKNKGFVHESGWPKADTSKMKNEQIVVVVQVNGKVRSQFDAVVGISENEAKNKAISDNNVRKYVENKEIKKVIFVPNKLINIVVGD